MRVCPNRTPAAQAQGRFPLALGGNMRFTV
jgi:hypothetical protein